MFSSISFPTNRKNRIVRFINYFNFLSSHLRILDLFSLWSEAKISIKVDFKSFKSGFLEELDLGALGFT